VLNVQPLEIVNSPDDGIKLDEVQSENKLIHLKKTRQLNKRPPSFRLKSKGEKIEDAESLLSQLQPIESNGLAELPVKSIAINSESSEKVFINFFYVSVRPSVLLY
jgi:hypothetical protein